jgi:peptidoglycan hydrolase CwlO-like protein
MKDPKTLITSAAGLLVVGIGTWLIATTADSTVEMATAEKDIEAISEALDDLESKVAKLQSEVYELKSHSHEHDKRGNVVE